MIDAITKIHDLNTRVGNTQDIRPMDAAEPQAQLNLVIEEMHTEILEATEKKNMAKLLDAAGDSVVVLVGLVHSMGFNMNDILEIIQASNDSKQIDPNNPEEVEASLALYENDPRYTDVYVNQYGFLIGTVVATGTKKFLKGIHFKEPDFTPLLDMR